jgi:hypothetical protein
MSNGSEHIPETLVGATDPPVEGAYPATAGEFAARWNSWTPERRQAWLDRRVADSQASSACWLGLHEHRIESLRAENEKLRRFERYINDVRADGGRVELGGVVVAPCNPQGRTKDEAVLDSMSVEWGVALPGESGFETPDRVTAESFVRDYPDEEYSLVKHLVGPWTVVPEGDGHE